jgi:hypothetical protein
MRLAQRNQPRVQAEPVWLSQARGAVLLTSFNLVLTVVCAAVGWLPGWTFLGFLLQWFETMWGTLRPATGWKPVQIGVRQLAVSILWTVAFVFTWRSG